MSRMPFDAENAKYSFSITDLYEWNTQKCEKTMSTMEFQSTKLMNMHESLSVCVDDAQYQFDGNY